MNYTLLGPSADSRDTNHSACTSDNKEACVHASDGLQARDIVQFTQSIFVAMEDDGTLELPIMRIGNLKGSVSVAWRTVEGSALDGVQFLHSSGVVTIDDGELYASIAIPILNSAAWNPTSEFQVVLEEPKGCSLGYYLKLARVKVADVTTFPNDDFKDQVEEGQIDSINEFTLFTGFISLLRLQPGIWWRTVATVSLDQLKNVYTYLKLSISIYMVDVVFNKDAPDEQLLIYGHRLRTAYVMAFLILVPVLVLHAAERIKVTIDIHGRLRSIMAQHVICKFMNYSNSSREDTLLADMVTSATTDVTAVSDGYMKVISMVRLAGKLAVSIFFTLQRNSGVWWATVAVPTLMIGWGLLRTKVYIKAKDASDAKEAGLISFINGVLSKIEVVAAYRQKPQMNDLFIERSEGFRRQKIPEAIIVGNNMLVPYLMAPVVVALYTAIGAELVLTGQINLGVYLATIQVFGHICSSFREMFVEGEEIISTFSCLKKLTELFNKPTDLSDMRRVSNQRQRITRKTIAKMDGSGAPPVDCLDISVTDLKFSYKDQPCLFQGLTFSCPQGKICAVRGASGSGRRTFLELLSHKMFPDEGTLYIPSHLRILYVSAEMTILNLSVWKNLTFGNSKGNDPDRVQRILEAFGMREVLSLVRADLDRRRKELAGESFEMQDEDEEAEWTLRDDSHLLDSLRESQRANIVVARALIMNPEVLVFARPYVHYHSVSRFSLLNAALREHRDNRGYFMPEATRPLRRPRSIFFTADHEQHEDVADIYWQLPGSIGGQCEQGIPEGVPASFPPHVSNSASSAAEQWKEQQRHRKLFTL